MGVPYLNTITSHAQPPEDEAARMAHIKAIHQEYYVGMDDAQHMLRLTRVAQHAPVAMAAMLRREIQNKDALVRYALTAERIVGICHVFDWYAQELDIALDDHPLTMPDHKLERRSWAINDIVELMCQRTPATWQGTMRETLFNPYDVYVNDGKLGMTPQRRKSLESTLRRVVYTAYDLGVRSDAELAGTAITLIQTSLLNLQEHTKHPNLLAKSVIKASLQTNKHFRGGKFTKPFGKGVLLYHLPKLFVNALSIENNMLKRLVHDNMCRPSPYTSSLANCFLHSVYARDGDEAAWAAQDILEKARVGEAPLGWDEHSPAELEALVYMVEHHKDDLNWEHHRAMPSID